MQPIKRRRFASFGDWLSARRKFLGLSQERLGQLVSYATVSIRKLESGSRRPSEAVAHLLVQALEVPAQHQAAFLISARTGLVERSLQVWTTKQHPLPLASEEQVVAANTAPVTSESFLQFATPQAQIYGRETEISQILQLLRQPFIRLITLLGAPGVGKTRLALEVLDRADSSGWPDGKFFVPLANIDHVTLIPEVIAATLGIREANTRKWRETQPTQQVFKFIQDKQLLLVLDNFEHLVNGAAFVTQLVAAAPLTKVIVTSRANLYIDAEQEFPILSLAVPSAIASKTSKASSLSPSALSLLQAEQNPAVALFTARAQARRPSFKLTEQNAAAVTTLCQRLDGLPLALELAAVRLRIQTPEELLAEISTLPNVSDPSAHAWPMSRSNALPFLNQGLKTMPQRHQTLSKAIAWSYNLLPVEAQNAFDQFGIFQGGFTREAAQAVTGASLDTLEVLATQSLMQIHVGPDDEIRLRLLEVIREFALNRGMETGVLEAAQQRHAEYSPP